MLGDRFKKARELLERSRNKIAQQIGINHSSISRIETDEIQNPNWFYTKYLVENGINPYFLMELSDEIKGKNLDDIIDKSEYEKLKTEFELLQSKYDTLQEMMKGLKIEMDEEGNLKKQK